MPFRVRPGDRRARSHERAGRPGEPLYQDVVTAFAEAMTTTAAPTCRASWAGATGSRPRNSRRRWSRRCSRISRLRRRRTTSRLASTTTCRRRASSTTRLHHRSGRRGRLHLLWPGRRRHGGREQELDQDHRRADAGLRAGVLRLRLEEGRVAHDVAPPFRAAADSLAVPGAACPIHRLSPVPVRRAHRRCCTRRSTARCSCSTAPSRRTISGTSCHDRCRRRSSASTSGSSPSTRIVWRPRPACRAGSTRSCRPVSSRFPACCRAKRRSPESRTPSTRPTRGKVPSSSRATSPPSTGRSRTCTR